MKNVKEQLREVRMLYGDLTKLKTKRRSLNNKIDHAISKQKDENRRANLSSIQLGLDNFSIELQIDWERITSSLMYDYNKILEFSIEDNNPQNVKRQLGSIKAAIKQALGEYQNDFTKINTRYEMWK